MCLSGGLVRPSREEINKVREDVRGLGARPLGVMEMEKRVLGKAL